MLKIGQNWGKIANYPPQCSTKIGTIDYNLRYAAQSRVVGQVQQQQQQNNQFSTV